MARRPRRPRMGRHRRLGEQRRAPDGQAGRRDDGRGLARPAGGEPPRLLLRLPGGGPANARAGQRADREHLLGRGRARRARPGRIHRGEGGDRRADEGARARARARRDHRQRRRARRDRHAVERDRVHAGRSPHLRAADRARPHRHGLRGRRRRRLPGVGRGPLRHRPGARRRRRAARSTAPSGMPGIELLVDGLDHPEGVCWDPDAGVLWAGGEAGQLYRVDVEARTWDEVARAPGFVLGLAVDSARPARDLLRRTTASSASTTARCGCSATACRSRTTRHSARTGRSTSPRVGGGARTTATSTGSRRTAASTCSPTSSPTSRTAARSRADGRWLWIVESYVPRLSRIDLASGAVEELARLDGTVPDGVAFTDRRRRARLVLPARPDPPRVTRGPLETIAEDPQGTHLAAPTNVVFAGATADLGESRTLAPEPRSTRSCAACRCTAPSAGRPTRDHLRPALPRDRAGAAGADRRTSRRTRRCPRTRSSARSSASRA